MTLFNNDTNNAPDPVVDETKDYLAELVGEGKKFTDAAALARGKAEADLFIERLKSEQAGLREELNKRDRLGELIDKLQNPSQPSNPRNEENNPPNNEQNTEAFDPKKLEEIVNGLIQNREQKTSAQKNIEAVRAELTKRFGDNFANKLRAEATKLGVSPEWMTSVAEQSPVAFYNLIGLNSQAPTNQYNPPENNNRSTFSPTNPNRNKTYYDEIKKRNPTEYWSPATQNQMHKDAIAQGEKFFS